MTCMVRTSGKDSSRKSSVGPVVKVRKTLGHTRSMEELNKSCPELIIDTSTRSSRDKGRLKQAEALKEVGKKKPFAGARPQPFLGNIDGLGWYDVVVLFFSTCPLRPSLVPVPLISGKLQSQSTVLPKVYTCPLGETLQVICEVIHINRQSWIILLPDVEKELPEFDTAPTHRHTTTWTILHLVSPWCINGSLPVPWSSFSASTSTRPYSPSSC